MSPQLPGRRVSRPPVPRTVERALDAVSRTPSVPPVSARPSAAKPDSLDDYDWGDFRPRSVAPEAAVSEPTYDHVEAPYPVPHGTGYSEFETAFFAHGEQMNSLAPSTLSGPPEAFGGEGSSHRAASIPAYRGSEAGSITAFDATDEQGAPVFIVDPELLRRRALFVRVVTGVVGGALLVALAGALMVQTRRTVPRAGNLLAQGDDSGPEWTVPVVVPAGDTEPEDAPVPARAAARRPAPSAALGDDTAGAAQVSPTLDAPASPSAAKEQARALIRRGKMLEAMSAAQNAVELAPEDAEGYLLLGAAYQEIGQWKQAVEVFERCALQATRGPASECRALGTR